MENSLIQTYIKELNDTLSSVSDETTLQDFVKLNQLESRFSRRLKSIAGGKKIYRLFINMILEEKENLITSRKFFRERELKYKESVYPAIRLRDASGLHGLKINFLFCSFAINNLEKEDKKLLEIFNEIKQLRESLINRHLHYALNRAKAFNNGSNYNTDFSDLIQLANEALVASVDKYVIDDQSSPFRTMALGRMIANLMTSSDHSIPVTLGGQASRKLYQLKRLLEKSPNINTKEISVIVGIAEEEIYSIINSTFTTSLDSGVNSDQDGTVLRDIIPSTINSHTDLYSSIENADMIKKMSDNFKSLTILEQKILKLKGINFEKYFGGIDD